MAFITIFLLLSSKFVMIYCSTCYQCTWSKQVVRSIENETSRFVPQNVFQPLFGRDDFANQLTSKEIEKNCKLCKMEFGGACVKWSYTETENGLVNVTRFCGWSPKTSYGCFEQKMGAGTMKEVCFCDDENCNTAKILSISHLIILFMSILSINAEMVLI